MRFSTVLFAASVCVLWLNPDQTQAQKVKSAPFAYLPERSEDRYNQRVTHKTLPLPAGGFIILAHRSPTEYAVERYDAELKKLWTATLPLTAEQAIDGFANTATQATVLVLQKSAAAQTLSAQSIDLSNGAKAPVKKLTETGPRERRPGAAFSPDGSTLR